MEQFHRLANVYFFFIVVLNWVPQISAFGREVAMLPLLFVLAVTAIKDAYEDRRRARQDKETNARISRVYDKSVSRAGQRQADKAIEWGKGKGLKEIYGSASRILSTCSAPSHPACLFFSHIDTLQGRRRL